MTIIEKIFLYILGYNVLSVRNSFILSQNISTYKYTIWYRGVVPVIYISSNVKSDIKFRWNILMNN